MSGDTSVSVLRVLGEASQPLSIDAVRWRAGIKSWDSARALLFELVIDGRIRGIKTSKGWVFWLNLVDQPLNLQGSSSKGSMR